VLQWCLRATAGPTWSGGRGEAALQIRPTHSRQTHGESRGDVANEPAAGLLMGMASWCSSGACERLLARLGAVAAVRLHYRSVPHTHARRTGSLAEM